MLTPEQIAARKGKVRASFVPSLAAGKAPRIKSEWRELIGDPTWKPEDLSRVWDVQRGHYLEKPMIDWHEVKTGHQLTRRGQALTHPTKPYVCCTLDCFREFDRWVLDAKAPGAYTELGYVLSFYVPQLVVQKACVGANGASLLICHGGAEPKEYPITWDDDYERRIWQLIDEFWNCVVTLTPPNDFGTIPLPIRAEKTYDMSGNNMFASEAVVWLQTYRDAKRASVAEKSLKALVPPDAARVTGHGVIVTRDSRGYLSLREDRS